MTDKILVEMTNDYRLYNLNEEFLKELKKKLIYHKWKIGNEKYKMNKEIN